MKKEIYDRAMAIMSSRRARSIAEYDMRVQEIDAKIPQIREINNVLFNSGKELIAIISQGKGADTQEKIEQVRRNNLQAQEMSRKLLAANGYKEDYLDVKYSCPNCNDTGYSGGKYCECFKKLCGKLSAEELNKNTKLNLSSFDTFRLSYYKDEDYRTMSRILDFARQYAESFNGKNGSIFMFGKTGLGKTHLSLAIANRVLERGFSVIYDSSINILRNIEKEHFSHQYTSEMIDLVMDTDLLILDDLGTEYETAFYNSTIYNIINTRLNSGKPTIISTNLDFSGISRRYDERMVSRLVADYTCLEFKGEDIRLQKRQEG